MCEPDTLPNCERNTSISTLPALQTLRATVWACRDKETLTRATSSVTPRTSLAIVFLLVRIPFPIQIVASIYPAHQAIKRRLHLSVKSAFSTSGGQFPRYGVGGSCVR